MPNVSSILKAEITRISRKEVRSATAKLKKAAAVYRSQIAELKRRAEFLEQRVRKLSRGQNIAPEASQAGDMPSSFRFSAKGLASHRKRLGLSAHDCGVLLGASGQSVYKWEEGKARPRAQHMPAIAALRTLGRKQAKELIAARG